MSPLLDSLLAAHPAADAALDAARAAARAALQADGLPARAEAWKYTSLRALQQRRFVPATAMADGIAPDLPDGARLVFVDGVFHADWSRLDALPDGIVFEPLAAALQRGDAGAQRGLQQSYPRADEPFARANAALAADGAHVLVAAGARPAAPLHLVLLASGDATDRAWHLRHRIVLGADARLVLVEWRRALGPNAHFANEIARIDLGAGAQLTHARLQDDSERTTTWLRSEATLAADARCRRLDLELGAALSRHELDVVLAGERAVLHANGVLFADRRRHLDTRLGIRHAARDTRCELVWRGLGAGRGRAVFHGGITIDAGADGSEAMLANKNLLLSEGAEIDTQPVLQIHADEVKAAHGATVGRLDPNALFYLRSRGVPAAQARALLTVAFCRELLDVLDDAALSTLLAPALDARLATLEAA